MKNEVAQLKERSKELSNKLEHLSSNNFKTCY